MSDLDPNTGHQVIRARPFKVSADRVEIRVSPRVSDGTTRFWLNEHGARGGCTSVGVYLNDQQRRDLIAVLAAQEPPVSSPDTAPAALQPVWTNAAGERWMDHPHEPDTLVLLSTSYGPTHHVVVRSRAAVETHGGPLSEVVSPDTTGDQQ